MANRRLTKEERDDMRDAVGLYSARCQGEPAMMDYIIDVTKLLDDLDAADDEIERLYEYGKAHAEAHEKAKDENARLRAAIAAHRKAIALSHKAFHSVDLDLYAVLDEGGDSNDE